MNRKIALTAIALAVTVACGKSKSDYARDSAAAADSLVKIADQAAGLAGAGQPVPNPATNPPPQPPPPPRPPAPPAPAPRSSGGTLASGSIIGASAIDSVNSKVTKVGDLVRVRVGADVEAGGKVVIPAGSVVTLAVTAIAQAPNRGDKGTLAMSARSVEIGGKSYDISGHASDYQYEMKARGVQAEDVAKTGAGAVVGGVAGHIIGGKTGTVVGAVGGAAAGAAVAAKTANRDIIVHAGNSVTITLDSDFKRG